MVDARAITWVTMPGSQEISENLKPFQAVEMGK